MNVQDIKTLRTTTGAGMLECKAALEQFNGNMEQATQHLVIKLGDKALKKADRGTNEGFIAHYVHSNGKMGSMVVLKCETDFVAKNSFFKQLAFDIAMHVVATKPSDVETLLTEAFVKDPSMTIKDYIHQTIGRLGENIVVENFAHFSI